MNTLLISLYPPNKFGGTIGGVVILLNDILSAATNKLDLAVFDDNDGDFSLPENITFVQWNKIAKKRRQRIIKFTKYSLFKNYKDYSIDIQGYDSVILYPYFSSLFYFTNNHAKIYTIGMDSGPLLYLRGILNHSTMKYRIFCLIDFIQAMVIDKHAVSISEKVFTVGESDAEFYRAVLLADATFVHHPVSSLVQGYTAHQWDGYEKIKICFPGGMTSFYVDDMIEDIFTLLLDNKEKYASTIEINFLGKLPSKKVSQLMSKLQVGGITIEHINYAQDFEEYISNQDIVLLPLKVGVGTKNKALTALGIGTDLIGTKIALENVYGVNGTNLADSAEEFVAQIDYRLNSHKKFGLDSKEADNFLRYHSQLQWKNNFWEIINNETNIE